MFKDKIDYKHPELLPYSDGSNAEILFSWVIGAIFVSGLLAALIF